MLSRRVPRAPDRPTSRALVRLAAWFVASAVLVTASSARAALQIPTTSLANATAGVPYSEVVEATNGTTPYTWTLDSGALPAGVVLDGVTGALSGTATLAGSYGFVVLVSDAVGDTATRALAITVVPATASSLSFSTPPGGGTAGMALSPAVEVKVADAFGNGVAGEPVSLALVGSGVLSGGGAVASDAGGIASFAALSIDVAGSKQLTASSGALTPVTSGAFTIAPGAVAALSFVVQPSDVVVGATLTPAVQVRAVDAFANPVPGASLSLTLIGAGSLSGGGAVLTDAAGIATFAALSVDRAGSAQLAVSDGALTPVASAAFTVSCPAITVLPASLPGGDTSTPYAASFSASGGTAPHAFTVSAGALPGGLSLSSAGELTGTPASGGAFSFTVRATDANLCTGERAYSIVICAPISVLPAALPPAQLGAAYSQTLSATGGVAPYAFALTSGALPAGLTLSGAGLLSGTPLASGSSAFTVTATGAGSCAGSRTYALTVEGVPAAVTDLAVVRVTSGNDGDGTSRMRVTFTPPAFAVTAEVYRAPFGGYPRYDDAGGVVPPTPSYPPGAPWVLTAVTASGQDDEPASRDAWSYVVFLKNSFAQVSGVSNKTSPTPNYALGDVSNGLAPGTGDNLVNDADISLLGAHYGISGAAVTTGGVHYLDVGPTVDLAVTSRPFTDGSIDFEDLIVFATNYGAVSAPAQVIAAADGAIRAARGSERLTVSAPSLVEPGEMFTTVVRLQGEGRIQGLSAELGWDAAVAEPVSVASAGWAENEHGLLLSARPGSFDVALLGARARGFSGEGELARVTFRARQAGDPQLRLARVLARDAANRPLGEAVLTFGRDAAIPARTLLMAPSPNPSRTEAGVTFALAHSGEVELAIYSVDGRRVRVLAHGAFAAGTYRFTWNGADEQQRPAAPGVYFAQLVAGGKRFSRTVIHLQ